MSILSEISWWVWIKIRMLPQPGLLKLVLNVFCTSNIQGRKLLTFYKIYNLHWAVWWHSWTDLFPSWYDAKLFGWITVWLTFMFTKEHRVKAVLNWAEHSVREQLCLLEMFKLAVRFLIDVFDLGEQLCSRPMGRRSDVRNVGSAGYGSMLLIGWTLSWWRRRNKKEARL